MNMKNNEKKKMTISAIVPAPWNYAHPDDNYCPFDLVPGSNGRWLLWWREENTWIASVPSLEVAHRMIIGTDDWHSQPGWDRSTFPLDIAVALKRQQQKTGQLPQFEFSETSNIFDLYVPLGLGFEAPCEAQLAQRLAERSDQGTDSIGVGFGVIRRYALTFDEGKCALMN
jgi:hypothetical protein